MIIFTKYVGNETNSPYEFGVLPVLKISDLYWGKKHVEKFICVNEGHANKWKHKYIVFMM